MEPNDIFKTINQNLYQGYTLEYQVKRAWHTYSNQASRSSTLLTLWHSLFPKDSTLSSTVHVLDFVDIPINSLNSNYWSTPCNLVVGRSIGIKDARRSNSKYLDDSEHIIDLFRLLYLHGDSIIRYTTSNKKSTITKLVELIRTLNLKEYLYPRTLEFSLTPSSNNDAEYTYHAFNDSPYSKDSSYSRRRAPQIMFKGTPEGHICKFDTYYGALINTIPTRTSRTKDPINYLVLSSAKAGLTDIINHLTHLTSELEHDTKIEQIKKELGKYIMLNSF